MTYQYGENLWLKLKVDICMELPVNFLYIWLTLIQRDFQFIQVNMLLYKTVVSIENNKNYILYTTNMKLAQLCGNILG